MKIPFTKRQMAKLMSWVGKHTSEKKAAASRANGLKGGKPRSKKGAGK